MNPNFQQQNLVLLNQRFPQLVEQCKDIRPGESGLHPRVISGDRGFPTVMIAVPGGRQFLHSHYDPITEAERWAASQTPPEESIVLIYGWGLGYHVLEWLKRYGPKIHTVIVYEPEAELFAASISCVDFQPLTLAKRLEIILGTPASTFDQVFHNMTEAMLTQEFIFTPLPFSNFYSAEATLFLKTEVQKMVAWRSGILHHMQTMGSLCQEHNIRNLPAMSDAWFPHEIRGLATGQPAIIVAAGPSLDQNLDVLPQAQSNAWIFAVDTSLRVLLQRGIEAQFVVTKDPTDRNVAHFDGLENLTAPLLIFDPQIDPRIPPKFLGSKICMPNRNYALHKYLGPLQLAPDDPMPHSTNVAITAFNIASILGCRPVIFVGLDLCFSREGGPSHAAQTALRSETWFSLQGKTLFYQRGEIQDQIQAILVEGIDGQMYPTSPNFYESLRLLETRIRESGVPCIDASEGGAKIAGTEILPLRETLQRYCHQPVTLEKLHRLPSIHRDHVVIGKCLHAISKHLQHCSHIAEHALVELKKIQGFSIPSENVIQTIQSARQEIERDYRLYQELQSALERLLVDISRRDFWKIDSQVGNEWPKRYLGYFSRIKEVCDSFIPIYQEMAKPWIEEPK